MSSEATFPTFVIRLSEEEINHFQKETGSHDLQNDFLQINFINKHQFTKTLEGTGDSRLLLLKERLSNENCQMTRKDSSYFRIPLSEGMRDALFQHVDIQRKPGKTWRTFAKYFPCLSSTVPYLYGRLSSKWYHHPLAEVIKAIGLLVFPLLAIVDLIYSFIYKPSTDDDDFKDTENFVENKPWISVREKREKYETAKKKREISGTENTSWKKKCQKLWNGLFSKE